MKFSIAVLLLFCGVANGQMIKAVDVVGVSTTTQVTTYTVDLDGDGIPEIQEPSDPILVADAVETPAIMVQVDPRARVRVEDANRKQVQVEPVEGRFLIIDPGTYWVRATLVKFDEATKQVDLLEETKTVVLGKPGPTAPAEPSLRVLITYESSAIPRHVGDIIASPIIRGYLGDRCPKDDNGTPMFRILDRDVTFTSCETAGGWWCESIAAAKTKGPWITLTNGTDDYSGPLPSGVAETLELLKSYGG